ncbi:hypothetical protein HPB50_022988 [Hyalomma asiaticum]|uniref:Uncharacterized protein n=1 Tax=Hyalomma asiaticum TaxID=266040 RepID=A0ACB7T6W1_HYAAI|nr:hypothetical protein HPB50_022988 [Hyalomma asiaticum]
MLSLTLKCIETMQWSLFDDHVYEFKMYSDTVQEIRRLTNLKVTPSTISMYIEVATMCTTVLLLHTLWAAAAVCTACTCTPSARNIAMRALSKPAVVVSTRTFITS